ncbi:MAG TPA: helix-turn-helix domain-containing protein [Alphaproteobacteria bacterium]|nr:helix-turn-helix domain-containing protein [Alphaproteobacteria bacterium]
MRTTSVHDSRALSTAIVATPDAGASCLFMLVDVLSSVGRDWEMLHGRSPRPPRFLPRLVSVDGKDFVGPNEARIRPHGALKEFPAPDVVLVPDLLVDPDAPLPSWYDRIAAWIRRAHDNGAIVASVCSGALLLARSGLLDGAEATTHWAYRDALARQFPKVAVRGERVLVPAGAGHRIITAGGASAWNDLLLYLVARLAGPEEALRIAKLYLLEWHGEGQLPFAALSAGRQHDDRIVAECQRWIADHYACDSPVAAMAGLSGLSERSFHRRFRQATGLAPIAYVQSLRIEEAKHLLETTPLPVDDVGAEVGYVEPASFRRLFRRAVGVSPSVYRRRFQPLFRIAADADARRSRA